MSFAAVTNNGRSLVGTQRQAGTSFSTLSRLKRSQSVKINLEGVDFSARELHDALIREVGVRPLAINFNVYSSCIIRLINEFSKTRMMEHGWIIYKGKELQIIDPDQKVPWFTYMTFRTSFQIRQ